MKSNIVIAWRNLWRNKRRTLITVASIFFGVLLSTVMSSMQEGSYSSMIDNIVKFYSGYIQIHNEKYWENKTINNTFEADEMLVKHIEDDLKLIEKKFFTQYKKRILPSWDGNTKDFEGFSKEVEVIFKDTVEKRIREALW